MSRFALLLAVLLTAAPAFAETAATKLHPVACEGNYPRHLQGVCAGEDGAIFWSFTVKLVKTDRDGKPLKKIDVASHHGDLCYRDGKVYVAVNLGKFNDPQGNADSWVYVYDADDLSLLAKHPTPEVTYGAGGVAQRDGRFLVVGGLPSGVEENYAYEYDEKFHFIRKHVLPSGHTHLGIQTAAFADGHWWFGCYGQPQILLKADADFKRVERFVFNCSLGVVPLGHGKFLVARGKCVPQTGCSGKLVSAAADPRRGLVVQKTP